MKKQKIAVYTALFGNYDALEPITFSSKCDFICFTDKDTDASFGSGWDVRAIDRKQTDGKTANRFLKILPHRYLSEYDLSLYIDSNIVLLSNPEDLITETLRRGQFFLPRHPERSCIYDEARECIVLRKSNHDATIREMRKYMDMGMPRAYGLGENNILFRNHHDDLVRGTMEMWWQLFSSGAGRDQFSLSVAMWKNRMRFSYAEYTSRAPNPYFRYSSHNHEKSRPIIRRITSKLDITARRLFLPRI